MILLFCVLFPIIYTRKIQIYPNENKLLNDFTQFGIIIDSNLTYQYGTIEPCFIEKQQINVDSQSIFTPNPQFSEEGFSQYYIDGTLSQSLSTIKTIVQTQDGFVGLSNKGELFQLAKEKDKYFKKSFLNLKLDSSLLDQPLFMIYYSKTEDLILIFNQETYKIKLKFTGQHFFAQSQRIYHSFNTINIKRISLLDDLLLIAVDDKLIQLFINKNTIEEIKLNVLFSNIMDFSIIKRKLNYEIHVADNNFGLQIIEYDSSTQQVNQIINDNSIKGNLIGSIGNAILIGIQAEKNSIIKEYKLIGKELILVNSHNFNGLIQNIEIADSFALIIGQGNHHQIIYHSLPINASHYENFILYGIKNILFTNKKGSITQELFAITYREVIQISMEIIPQLINCRYQDEIEMLNIKYTQLSTSCPNFIESPCLFEEELMIQFVHPIITTQENTYIYLISIMFGIIIIGGLCYIIIEFRKFSDFMLENAPQEKYHSQTSSQSIIDLVVPTNSMETNIRKYKL